MPTDERIEQCAGYLIQYFYKGKGLEKILNLNPELDKVFVDMYKKGYLDAMERGSEWVDNKLAEIAAELPALVHYEPKSFTCGFQSGYKQALLDFEGILEAEEKPLCEEKD